MNLLRPKHCASYKGKHQNVSAIIGESLLEGSHLKIGRIGVCRKDKEVEQASPDSWQPVERCRGKRIPGCLFPGRRSVEIQLLNQWAWLEHWAGETKIWLFIFTHPCKWASIPVTGSTHNPHRCGFSVCHHTHMGETVRACRYFSIYPWPQLKNDSEMVLHWVTSTLCGNICSYF